MSLAETIQVISTIVLATAALLAPFIAELLKRNFYAPHLKISFKLSQPFCGPTTWRSSTDEDAIEPVYYYRFSIENTGRSQAEKCEAVLESLYIYDSADRAHKVEQFIPIRLGQENGQAFIDINPLRTVYCAIGHISSLSYQLREEKSKFIDISGKHGIEPRFMFDLLYYPFSQPNCLVPGIYAYWITVYSVNSDPVSALFKFNWSGKWQDNENDMHREAVLSMLRTG